MAAPHALLCVLSYIIIFPVPSFTTRNTRIQVTSINSATIGGILAIQCQVWNLRDNYEVNFFHDVNGQTKQVTFETHYAPSSLGQRSYLAKRTFPDGSHVLFLTVVDVEQGDEGRYLCKAYSWSDGHNNILEDLIDIRIYSFPKSIYPSCDTTPNIASVSVGNRLMLKCTCERTFPLVTLTWSSSSDSSISHNTRNATTHYIVSFETSFVLQPVHNGAVFVCTMTSPGFPERERSCLIGPLDINHDSTGSIVGANSVSGVSKSGKNKASVISDTCKSCPEKDQFTLLYWGVALVGTSILMFIFLTTTIIWCCKYHTLSSNVTQPVERRSVTYTSGDVVDPVYVSLQRRTEHDRNSTYSTYVTRPEPDRSSTYSSYSSYMTVEDPSNPGNKVIMPKEVFDEFYRSLSLKKNREPKPEIKDAVIPLGM